MIITKYECIYECKGIGEHQTCYVPSKVTGSCIIYNNLSRILQYQRKEKKLTIIGNKIAVQ